MAIRFLLGDRVCEPRQLDPTQTVLQWLRANGRTGTKEGCAEGDCGACTVVLVDRRPDGTLDYQAANACILFMPVLDGKQLITIEDLQGRDGALHPLQAAMVEHHASQCGFCTPGFVMSLLGLFHQPGLRVDDETVHDALAGNLCRCTGYRPIVTAAGAALRHAPQDRFTAGAAATASRLAAIASDQTLALDLDGRRYFAPRRLDELAALLMRYPDAHLLAGGTDIGLWVTKEQRRLETVIYLGAVAGLDQVDETATELVIGAGASYTRVLPIIARRWPSFAALIARLGSVPIRNLGTMGGNIANASPIGDSPPALIALRARIILHRDGVRRELPLEDFFIAYRRTALLPGEFVERIKIPLDDSWTFATYKVSKRRDQDISAVAVGIAVKLDGSRVIDVRIAFGGMAATPKRARAAEDFLRGRAWTRATVAAAGEYLDEDFAPLTDMRASAEYRALAAKNLLLRFFHEHAGEPVRLSHSG